jgi:DNA-binding transcriptional LysR family regulator
VDRNALDGLIALKLVAENRHFGLAAEELGISTPAISRIIKLLEQRLGVMLLNRTSRDVSLTAAGERFLSRVGPAIDQIFIALKELETRATPSPKVSARGSRSIRRGQDGT